MTPAAQSPPCRPADLTANGILWMQNAAEYDALGQQAYMSALRQLDTAIADPSWTALPGQASPPGAPPAVVLDVDETVLDTSHYQTGLIRRGIGYNEDLWSEYQANETSRPVPGALEFLHEADRRGVKVFFVTNRRAPTESTLRAFLARHGFPLASNEDTLLMRGEGDWTSRDKSGRRFLVASKYRLIMLFGDDLNDFVDAEGKSTAERSQLVRENRDRWGSRWFIIPNPIYGSWERALGLTDGLTPCDRVKRKIELLEPRE